MARARACALAVVVFWLCGHVAAAKPTPQKLFADADRVVFEAKPVESARVFDQLALVSRMQP